MPTLPDCKHDIDVDSLLTSFYKYFLCQLFSRPGLIQRLFGEKRKDVHIVLNGTYKRTLLTGATSLAPTSLTIQRVLVISNAGERLYSRALLPGLIIPHSQYSLQLVLYCLCRFYSGSSVGQVYADTGIDPRTLRKWIHIAGHDNGIISSFLKLLKLGRRQADLPFFFSTAGIDTLREGMERLYRMFSPSTRKWAPWFPDGFPAFLQDMASHRHALLIHTDCV